MDIGKVQVAQPDVGRVGGIGEAKIVCDMAAERGLTIVPHCWKTGISISATAHLAFVTPSLRLRRISAAAILRTSGCAANLHRRN